MFVDDAELGQALVRLLSDAALRETMMLRGLERSRTFGWDNVVSRYEAVFENAIAGKNRSRRATAS
jgi:glycosyltransferase involved in cell wall biosynthesis